MLRKLLALCLVCVAALLLLELLVRTSGIVRHLYTEPGFEMAADGSHWRYRPGFRGYFLGPTEVQIGPSGARLTAAENVGGTLRVAVFGDSITFGQAVAAPETFSARLERRLRQRWPASHVLNFGVQGHTVAMEVAHLATRLNEVQPALVALVFGTDDLNPERERNRVDRFGYLTKITFGPPSVFGDLLRVALRQSHVALAVKDIYLLHAPAARRPAPETPAPPANNDRALAAFRVAMRRFDSLTSGLARVVMCVDLRETPLTRDLAGVMRTEFPHIDYIDAAPTLTAMSLTELRVPRDGHPNARAHALYAGLLAPRVEAALEPIAPPL